MPSDCISFRDTHYFSELICDYLDEVEPLQSLYHRFPKIENFEAQIAEKKNNFSPENRSVLEQVLLNQYQEVDASLRTHNNIVSLKDPNTFTIVTGHQLNLFTGPLYFLYKIISAINLTKQLKEKYPDCNFVPIYWMATEDHDFEEINYFNFQGKKVQWTKDSTGAVGRFDTKGLDQVKQALEGAFGKSKNGLELIQLFESAYLENNTLSDATRYLANALFGEFGLVIIDADDQDLKALMKPYFLKEVEAQKSFQAVSKTNALLNELNYKVQVNPRDINLFYMVDGIRERLTKDGNDFKVVNTAITWSKADLINEIENHPERFSPNVIMRPLYQEVILPNLCYIGGGGELAYWLQLKDYFDEVEVSFPILLVRNSVLLIPEKLDEKLKRLNVLPQELFVNQIDFLKERTKTLSDKNIDFSEQKNHLKEQFKALYQLAETTDKSFIGAVAAQEKKQLKGLDQLEKRLLRAEKRRLKDILDRMTAIQDELFPNGSLQERQLNFSEVYLEMGDALIPFLMDALDPLDLNFSILTIQD